MTGPARAACGRAEVAVWCVLLQRLFTLDQADWMRDVMYKIVVSATSEFGRSDNSSEWEFLTP